MQNVAASNQVFVRCLKMAYILCDSVCIAINNGHISELTLEVGHYLTILGKVILITSLLVNSTYQINFSYRIALTRALFLTNS